MNRFTALLLGVLLILPACTTPEPEPAPEPQPVDTTRPAWVDSAVIYEVFVRNFTPEGTFRGVIERLPELKDLGVTTLWLMPIHPISEARRKGTLGSPYAIQDFYAVNPNLGTEEDFRALVDAVHDEGMTLILDLVANHTGFDNAWLDEHPDWYTTNAAGEITHPEGTDWTDVADLDYDNPAVREEMARVMRYWVEEFDIDGYRCDVAELVPLDFWESAIADLRAVKPVMMLAEGAEPELHEHGFDLTYAWDAYHALKNIWDGTPADSLIALVQRNEERFPDDALRLRFTTNHDETAWDATPVELFDGRDGAMAASVVMMTLPGVPLLYNGQEIGSEVELPLFEKDSINWSLNPQMERFYDELLVIRNGSGALKDGDLVLHASEDADVFLYERVHEGERMVIAVNPRAETQTVVLPNTLQGTTWTDAFSAQTLEATSFDLAPYGTMILHNGAARRTG